VRAPLRCGDERAVSRNFRLRRRFMICPFCLCAAKLGGGSRAGVVSGGVSRNQCGRTAEAYRKLGRQSFVRHRTTEQTGGFRCRSPPRPNAHKFPRRRTPDTARFSRRFALLISEPDRDKSTLHSRGTSGHAPQRRLILASERDARFLVTARVRQDHRRCHPPCIEEGVHKVSEYTMHVRLTYDASDCHLKIRAQFNPQRRD